MATDVYDTAVPRNSEMLMAVAVLHEAIRQVAFPVGVASIEVRPVPDMPLELLHHYFAVLDTSTGLMIEVALYLPRLLRKNSATVVGQQLAREWDVTRNNRLLGGVPRVVTK